MTKITLAVALTLALPLTAARTALAEIVEPVTPEPIQATIQFDLPDGYTGWCADLCQVPARRRLVVEYASALVQMPFTEPAKSIQLRTWLDGERVDHHLDVRATGAGNDSRAAHPVRLYADGDTGVSVCAYRQTSTGVARVRVSIAGHLE